MFLKPIERLPNTMPDQAPKFARLPHGPERLVGMGFRCWLAGYQTKDIDCWEAGWKFFQDELGAQGAKNVVSELVIWVRTLHHAAAREIEVYPTPCSGFCRDECMAVVMVAAAQQDTCPALKACAYVLLESTDLDGVIDATARLAGSLQAEGITLNADSVVLAPAAVNCIERTARH